MSDIVEGLGTAVEGGLFAKAVSEKPGDGPALDKGHFAEGACLNCGTPLVGEHCHACGQKAHLHRTLSAFMHDVAHGAVHFDSKTWRTLPRLIFKPGELTRRYIDGERTRFVSPMALFLFSIFLMFAIFQFAGISAPTDFTGNREGELRELAGEQLERLETRRDTLAERAENNWIEVPTTDVQPPTVAEQLFGRLGRRTEGLGRTLLGRHLFLRDWRRLRTRLHRARQDDRTQTYEPGPHGSTLTSNAAGG